MVSAETTQAVNNILMVGFIIIGLALIVVFGQIVIGIICLVLAGITRI